MTVITVIDVTSTNDGNLLRKIADRFEDFSPKHRALAKYLLEHYLDLAYVTITEFAQSAGVSETTIVRFVYLLGFRGFTDFMAALRAEIERSKATSSAAMCRYTLERGRYDFPRDALRAVFTLEMSVMEETLAKIPPDLFEKAVDAVSSASRLVLIGCGANRCLSQAAYFALNVLRPNVALVETFDLAAKGLVESMPKQAVCLVFSTPRYNRETQSVLECLEQCRYRPFIVGVTDSLLSPIAPHADLVLQVAEKFVLFTDANAAYMALIHALAFALYLKNPDYSKKRIEAYDTFVKEHNFFVRDYLDLIDF
jgi:Transcriptional regulators